MNDARPTHNDAGECLCMEIYTDTLCGDVNSGDQICACRFVAINAVVPTSPVPCKVCGWTGRLHTEVVTDNARYEYRLTWECINPHTASRWRVEFGSGYWARIPAKDRAAMDWHKSHRVTKVI